MSNDSLRFRCRDCNNHLESLRGSLGGPNLVRRMESKEDSWLDTQALPSVPFPQPASVMENQGSGDYSSHDGSLPSSSSTSSSRNHSTGLIDGADNVSAMLKDDDVRAILKKVTVNEGVLNKAIQSLGGGEKGLKSLMGYIMQWLKQQKDSKSSHTEQLSNRPLNLATGDVALEQNSDDAFQILSGIFQPPAAQAPVEQEDLQHFQRFKSRRLMMGEPEIDAGLGGVETGFCPSNFMSVGVNLEEYSLHKTEMASPGIMAPWQGMQQPVPRMPSITTTHIAMSSVEQTPAMTTKAARRHRMARQRQSMMNQHARAASHATPVSVGPWNAAPPAVMKTSGMSTNSGVAQALQTAPVTAARKVRFSIQLKVQLRATQSVTF